MIHTTIEQSSDVLYPFSKEWYDDPFILYHGTSSIYSESIEHDGWNMNEQPYDIADFQKICNFFEDIGWDGTPKNSGYSVLRSFSLGGDDNYVDSKPVSFSQIYWTARNYSRNIGGESIHYFFLAIEDILNMCESKQLQDEHRKFLEDELKEFLDMQKKTSNPEFLNNGINRYENFLENFSTDFLNNSKNITIKLQEKYEHFKKIHFPVVYVVKVEPDWFENNDEFDILDDKSLELRAKTNISSSSLIARIDFPNGIDHMTVYSNGSQPVSWEREEWNKRCIEFKTPEFRI